MEWLHRKNMYMDLFVCGAKPEYEYIRDTFGYPEHVPQYVGLARFDNLIRAERKEKMILVMPTWRGSYYPTGEAFRNTAYYEHFQSLLCCKELEQLLEQQDYRLVFYPHIEMQKDSRRFKSGSDRITIVSKETHDVQELLMDCALLVTDYSSVFLMWRFCASLLCIISLTKRSFVNIIIRRDISISAGTGLDRYVRHRKHCWGL